MRAIFALCQPERLESLAAEQLAAWIGARGGRGRRPHDADTEAALAHLTHYLRRHVPRTRYDALFHKALPHLRRAAWDAEPSAGGRLLEPLLTDNLTSLTLSVSDFNMIRESLCSRSYALRGVIQLHLQYEEPTGLEQDAINLEADVIPLLKRLCNLKYLTVTTFCTNDLLTCIAQNCPLIEELEVPRCRLNDDSIDILARMRNLKCITIGILFPTRSYLEKLISSCKNIEHINRYRESKKITPWGKDELQLAPFRRPFDLTVVDLTSAASHAGKTFNLKSYISIHNTLEQLQAAFRTLPSIQTLTVHRQRGAASTNIMAVIGLRYLRELKLVGYRYYEDRVNEALPMIGCNLERLDLLEVEQIDLNAMIDISQTCRNLERLSLGLCTFVSRGTPSSTKALEFPPFRNLLKLNLGIKRSLYYPEPLDSPSHSSQTPVMHEPVFFLLSNCLYIEFIKLIKSDALTEDIMLNILDKNPMSRLKELRTLQSMSAAESASALTELVVRRLARTSINETRLIQVYK